MKIKRQAFTCIMRRIVNIIFNILKNDVPYKHPKQFNEQCLSSFLERTDELGYNFERKSLLSNVILFSKSKTISYRNFMKVTFMMSFNVKPVTMFEHKKSIHSKK